MKLAITHYTERLKEHMGGCAIGFVVLVRPKYRNDAGLHAHEYLHVKQFWVATLVSALALLALAGVDIVPLAYLPFAIATHPMLYMFVPAYRLWAEVACYREQMRYYADDRSLRFAGFLAKNYGLKISVAEAQQRLKVSA